MLYGRLQTGPRLVARTIDCPREECGAPVKILCEVDPGEARTHDYPGSAGSFRILEDMCPSCLHNWTDTEQAQVTAQAEERAS